MNLKTTILCLPVLICACSSGGESWSNPDKTEQDFRADRAQCNAMAGYGNSNQMVLPTTNTATGGLAGGFANGWNMGDAMGAASARNQMFEDCMYGKGYRLVSNSQHTSSQEATTTVAATEVSPKAIANNTEPPTSDSDAGTIVLAEIRKIPELDYWRQYDQEKFDYAVSVDEELKQDSYWQDRSLAERFREATKRTMKHFNM